jgi:release factor glutamine methyltransferase
VTDDTGKFHDYAVLALREAIADGAATLAGAGVDAARVDAELLAAHLLGVPRGKLALVDDLEPDQLLEYRRLIAARATRVPLQHLLGTAAFRYLELAVGPGGFVPRPETELLVDWGLAEVAGIPAPIVVDLGSGTGAIALSVAGEHPGATVYAVERAPAALAWLRRNVADGPVRVVTADITDPRLVTDPHLLGALAGRVDLVLCNPPYVPDGAPVGPEVAGFDPADAVFGGPDGLAVIRPVIERAAELLRPGGGLGIEHDDSHGTAVPALLTASGHFDEVAAHRDLAGRPRFATARRSAPRRLTD